MPELAHRLVLGPGVVDYTTARGGALTLRHSPRHGCCGGTASLPVAEPMAPHSAADYVTWEQEGLRVFVGEALVAQLPLTVRLDGLFGFKRLFVEGAVLSASKP